MNAGSPLTGLQRLELRTNVLTSTVQTVLLVVIAAYAIYQYEAGQRNVLEDRSIDLMDEYYLGEVADSRRTVSSILNTIDAEWKNLRSTADLPEDDVLRITRFSSLAINQLETGGQLGEIRRIIDFYDLVHWCLEESMCSQTPLVDRLAQEAVSYFTFTRGYIECTRLEYNVPSFGNGLQQFVDMIVREVEDYRNRSFEVRPDCSQIELAALVLD